MMEVSVCMVGYFQKESGPDQLYTSVRRCSTLRCLSVGQVTRTTHDWTIYYWHQLRYV